MIHECNVFCHSTESDLMELMGNDDPNVGKWLPFAVDLSLVVAVKMTTDEDESMVYRCSTIFLNSGDVYIIDTMFREFIKLWNEALYKPDENDLDLSDDDEDSFNL